EPLGIGRPLVEAVPPHNVVFERNRFAEIRRAGAPVDAMDFRQRAHRLTAQVPQRVRGKGRAPLGPADAQYVTLEHRHGDVGTTKQTRIRTRPAHAAVRHVGVVEGVQDFYLAQHVGRTFPLHVRWGQANEPALRLPATVDAEPVGEAGVAGHLVHVEYAHV